VAALLLLLQLASQLPVSHSWVTGILRSPAGPSSGQQQRRRRDESDSADSAAATKEATKRLRVRTTTAEDIPAIAEMLSVASVSASKQHAGWNWKAKMDQMWAKSDLEGLLSRRLEAVEEGKKALARTQKLVAQAGDGVADDFDDLDLLRAMWTSNGKLQNLIERASQDTGEDNVWRNHNMAVPPQDRSWLNHLQISVVDDRTGAIVGFCEVAMLSNPVVDDDNVFSPAITNLATAPEWRRRGIASRLLSTAERFVRQRWTGTDSLGLFVEKENEAAMGLYRKFGYETTVTCEGDDRLGDMFYMTRQLVPRDASQQKLQKREEVTVE